MGLKSAKILFNKPSSQRWDTSEIFSQKNIKAQINRLISSAQDIAKRRCVMDPNN